MQKLGVSDTRLGTIAQQAGTEGSGSKGQESLHRYWIDDALKQRRLHLVPRIKAAL